MTKDKIDFTFITNTRSKDVDWKEAYGKVFPNWKDNNFSPPPVFDSADFICEVSDKIKGKALVIGSTAVEIVTSSGFKKARREILDALEYSKDLEARVICFGAGIKKLISTAELIKLIEADNRLKSMIFTIGDTLTTAVALKELNRISELCGIDFNNPDTHVVIIGAYGNLGKAISFSFATKQSHLMLVGPSWGKLKELAIEFEKFSKIVEIANHHNLVQKGDVVITVTNHPKTLMNAKDLLRISNGKPLVALDIAQPSNIYLNSWQRWLPWIKNRIIRLDGGIIRHSKLKGGKSLSLKDNEVFACVGEAFVLSSLLNNSSIKFSPTQFMEVDLGNLELIFNTAHQLGFELTSPASYQIPIEKKTFLRFKRARLK